ncbi:hypothetical protein SAMN04487983_10568 [Streptomyces sp. yr375]|nr:hypothetical protein [Streptomyces sp. yr375]SES44688.1 hypothetical protein SAMN04487983_10568 [Streptomyces sp. yr375]
MSPRTDPTALPGTRRPRQLAAVGVYDETSAAGLPGTPEPASREAA